MSYNDTGFNQFIDKAITVPVSLESSEQDFEAKVESIPKEKISGGGKFSSKTGNLTIDFDTGFISVKDNSGKEKVRLGNNDSGEFTINILDGNGLSMFPSFAFNLFKDGVSTGGGEITTTNLTFSTVPGSEKSFTLAKDSTLLIAASALGVNLDSNNSAMAEVKVFLDGEQVGTLIRFGGSRTSDDLTYMADSNSMSVIKRVNAGIHNIKLLFRNSRAGGTTRLYDRSMLYLVLD